MASTDAKIFPLYATALRVPVSFRDTSGNLITTWTGAASTVYADGASVASPPTPTEYGTTGMGYVDLTATHMTGKLIQVKCTITNASAVATIIDIPTADLRDNTGRPATLDGMITATFRRWFNKRVATGTTITIGKDSPNESTTLWSGTVSTSGVTTTGGEIS